MTPTWYLTLLSMTVLVELPVALLLAPSGSRRRLIPDAVLLNGFTHPLAAIAVYWLGAPLPLVEFLVFLAEAAGYHRVSGFGIRRAIVISLSCNAITTAIGLMISSPA